MVWHFCLNGVLVPVGRQKNKKNLLVMSGQFATKYVILRDLKYYYYFHFLENEIALPQNCKEDLICKFGFAESPQTSGLY